MIVNRSYQGQRNGSNLRFFDSSNFIIESRLPIKLEVSQFP